MQSGIYRVGEIGHCELVPVSVSDGSKEFWLYSGEQEVGFSSVAPDPRGAQGLEEIQDLYIEEGFRGKGASSFLVDRVVDFVKEKDSSALRTCAVNERTVSAFCRHFNPERLRFLRKFRVDQPPRPIDMDANKAISFLRKKRETQKAQSGETGALEGFGIHIIGQLT